MDNLNWRFEQDAAGRGMVRHHAPPRFVAYWTSGPDGPPLSVPCWRDAGGGGEDSLHIFGFQWIDRRPDPATFQRLMREAAAFLDAWIAGRL